MRIVAAGVSGFLGQELVRRLTAAGHSVVRLIRRPASGPDERQWDPDAGTFDAEVLGGVDAVVNLCGVGVGDRRWTEDYKREIVTSRVRPTSLLAAAAADHRVPALINASAIGFYGARGDEPLDEDAARGSGFFPDCCAQWEAASEPASAAGVRVVNLRTGLVLGPDGGLLPRLTLITKLFAGGKLGTGRQYYSWIARTDWVRAVEFLLTSQLGGPVNLTAPNPVRNADFVKAIGRLVHRPTPWPVPTLALRLVLGEFADDVVTGQRVVPGRLGAAGFDFRYPDLDAALAAEAPH